MKIENVGLSIGAIIGITFGCIAFITLGIIIIFCCMKRSTDNSMKNIPDSKFPEIDYPSYAQFNNYEASLPKYDEYPDYQKVATPILNS